MDFDIDPAKVLYAVGVVFGVAAVVYFARDIVFELSITVRALLLFLAFAVLLVAGLAFTRKAFVLVSAVLSAVAYLAFITYSLSRFEVGADGTFLALLVSAGLFLTLGYLVHERNIAPSVTTALYVTAGVVLIGAVLVGADVVASDVTYNVTLQDEAGVDDRGEVVLGTIMVENQFVFREPIGLPQAFACVSLPETTDSDSRLLPVQYRVDDGRVPNSIPGSGTITVTMTVRLSDELATRVANQVPIERGETCPDVVDAPRIVVVTGDDVPRPSRP